LQHPLALKHAKDKGLEFVSLGPAQRSFDFSTADPLSLGQQRVQESATCIGIDFDQLGPFRRKMEVVAHEDTARTEVLLCNVRRPGQYGFPIGGKSGCRLDRVYDPSHPNDVYL
jgi:hypothetical protein